MKNNIKYLATVAFASMSLVGCNDLDTQPENNYVTSQEKQEAIASKPDLASAGVVGISSAYNQYMAVYSSAHCDFGWPAALMMLESCGTDLVADNIGYNWFASAANYNLGTTNNYVNNLSWYYGYKIIGSANDVLRNIDPETTDPNLQLFAAQAYANRAYIYFSLAQLFQSTYKGNESKPCVPLITEENSDAAATEGCPRATVEETYAQVLSDLDKAIKFLSESGLSVDKLADTAARNVSYRSAQPTVFAPVSISL